MKKQRKPYDSSNRPIHSETSEAQRLKRDAEKSEFSPYARLQENLRNVRVIDLSTGRVIPKYVLWDKIGRKENEQYRMVMQLDHPGYRFMSKLEYCATYERATVCR